MRELLFLAHRLPFPPDRGDKIRSYHLLRYLSERFHVHVAAFADDEAEAAQLPMLRTALNGRLGEAHVAVRRSSKLIGGLTALGTGKPMSLTLFDDPDLRTFTKDMLMRPALDSVVAYSGQMAQFVPADARQRFLMDFVDVDSAKFDSYADAASGPMRWVYRREGEKLSVFERAVAGRADVAIFASDAEADVFRDRTGLANVMGVSNGIDTAFYNPSNVRERPTVASPLIVFTGQMDYAPNVDAVRWFAAEVLPLLPDAHFAIVGRAPTAEVRALAGARITVTGGVPDVRPWMAAAHLVVAPLRIARGIQNKVLEAMAMARPVLASPEAFEGIEATPGSHLLVAQGAQDMAAAAREVLADADMGNRMGQAARTLMIERHGWTARLSALDALLGLERKAAA